MGPGSFHQLQQMYLQHAIAKNTHKSGQTDWCRFRIPALKGEKTLDATGFASLPSTQRAPKFDRDNQARL